jgi:hypothetical protein
MNDPPMGELLVNMLLATARVSGKLFSDSSGVSQVAFIEEWSLGSSNFLNGNLRTAIGFGILKVRCGKRRGGFISDHCGRCAGVEFGFELWKGNDHAIPQVWTAGLERFGAGVWSHAASYGGWGAA